MAKPKFESRLQVWVPTRIAEAFEALADDGMLAVSDHIRLALSNHFAVSASAPCPPPIGRR
jgi:hypothetical protein